MALARRSVELGEAYKSERKSLSGAAFGWHAGRGIEVWTTVKPMSAKGADEDYEIISCLAGFRPDDISKLRAYKIARHFEREGEMLMQGRFAEGGTLLFALLNLWQHSRIPAKGGELEVQLGALALEGEWANAKDAPRLVDEVGGDPLKDVESVLLPLDRDCHYRAAGIIGEARLISNMHSGVKLWRIKVKLPDFEIELLSQEREGIAPPQVGQRFDGIIWLCGFLPVGRN